MTCPCRDCQCRRWSLHQKPRNQGNLKVIGFWWIANNVKISENEEMGDDDATPPGDLLPSGALFIVPGRFSNSEKCWFQYQRLGHLRCACWKARQRVQSRMVRPQKLKNNEIWCCPLSSGELSGFLILNSSFEYIMWVGFSFLWAPVGCVSTKAIQYQEAVV